ncbi:D-alanyl-D-alanine carboxypeptidase, partial [Klebsiella pneumoniae]
AGEPARVELWPYFAVTNAARTVPGGETRLGWDRDPNGKQLRITGTIGADAQPKSWKLGIDDPADYAAWRLKALLEARGVKVKGHVEVRHRPVTPQDDPADPGYAAARAVLPRLPVP